MKRLLPILTLLLVVPSLQAEPALKALIIDGQNNHNWAATTPYLKKYLEQTGMFQVDVATLKDAQAVADFKPEFEKYQIIVLNYNGKPWTPAVKSAFAKFVSEGGGFVCVHAANNAFVDWPEYNEMIGVGGWGGRSEKSGPYIRIRNGAMTLEQAAGRSGSHGKRHPFKVELFDKTHPITAGLPAVFLHAEDELYDRLRGPGKNVTVLGTAFADPKTGGSGEVEPMLMAMSYGKGRVFHTTLGHDVVAMKCVGFIATYQRGAEWAATGKVTQKVPADFPTAEKVSSRE